MKAILICPIRTLINLNTDIAYGHAAELHEVVERACRQAAKKTGSTCTSVKTPPQETAYIKYSNLEADHRPWASKPLATIALKRSVVEELEAFAPLPDSDAPSFAPSIERIDLSIYDNTIAIAQLHVELDLAQAATHFDQPAEFEQHITLIAARLCRRLQKDQIEPFLRALDSAARSGAWTPSTPLLRKPKEFVAFDDLAEHPYPKWIEERETMAWAHRVFDLTTLQPGELGALPRLMRQHQFEGGAFYRIKWGTSFIIREGRLDKFLELSNISQYFYSVFDCLGHSQKRLLRRVVGQTNKVDLRAVSKRFDKQESLVSETTNEFLDYVGGLQDINADIFHDIEDAFGTETLIKTLEKRSAMLQARIDRISAEKSRMLQRLVSFVLILVGGTQIMGLALNIWWYAGVEPKDDVPGFLDLAASISPDLALNICLAASLLGGGFWVLRNQRPQ